MGSEKRYSDRAFVVCAPGFGDGFVPVLDGVGAAADPGQRHELHLLVLVEVADKFGQDLGRGVVRLVFEHVGHPVVGGVGARIRVAVAFLAVEHPRFRDDVADLFRIDCQHGYLPLHPFDWTSLRRPVGSLGLGPIVPCAEWT